MGVLYTPDYFTWISVSKYITGNIFGNYTSGAYCYILSYSYSGENY